MKTIKSSLETKRNYKKYPREKNLHLKFFKNYRFFKNCSQTIKYMLQ